MKTAPRPLLWISIRIVALLTLCLLLSAFFLTDSISDWQRQFDSQTAEILAAPAAWAAAGHKVYPLHLGDINLPTPANIVEATAKAIADGHTGYCAGAGIPPCAPRWPRTWAANAACVTALRMSPYSRAANR